MKIYRYFVLIVFLIAALADAGRAQITNTASTDFTVLDTLNPIGLKGLQQPYFMADNRMTPTTRAQVNVVTAWSTNASADSAWSYTKGQRTEWVVSLTNWSASDSLILFSVREYQSATRTLMRTYTQYVNYGTVKKQGANWYNGAAHNEANFGNTPLGLNLAMADYATILQSVGWRWHLYLWDVERFETAADSGALALAVYSKYPGSRLTLSTGRDTSLYGAGIFASDPFPLDNPNITIWAAFGSPNATTQPAAELSYAVSWDSVSWYGALDDAVVAKDTLYKIADFNAPRGRVGVMPFIHVFAPWGKLVWYGADDTRLFWMDSCGVYIGK